MVKKGLGKGLGALIIENNEDDAQKQTGLTFMKINQIEPNNNQPRRKMEDSKLQELADSIKHHGVVQPIIVNNDNGVYRIVAGERRWRAARLAGLTEVPVIIKELTVKEVLEVALIENIQREDLNPVEEAAAFERLIKDHAITHEELSNIIGKSRPYITNTLRLLGLCAEVREMLANGEITSGHGRALLIIEDPVTQLMIAEQIANGSISVRETELLVKRVLMGKNKRKQKNLFNEYEYLVNDLQEFFGTRVKIMSGTKNRGKIMIDYYSQEDLDRIVNMVNDVKVNSKKFLLE